MNQKELRKINTQVKVILVEWVKTLLPEEEALKVNVDNVLDSIPSQTHFFANQQAQLSAYTPKWIRKHIKIFIERVILKKNIMHNLNNPII